MKRIRVTINKDGTQRVEVFGAQGMECVKFTEKLEERLGVPVGDRAFKPEYEVERERMRETERQVEYES